MEKFEKILESKNSAKAKSHLQYMKCSYAECIAANRLLRKHIDVFSENTKIDVAILGSYTFNNLVEPMWLSLLQKGFLPSITTGEYNQYVQEILDEKSRIRAANPDIIIVLLDTETFLEGIFTGFNGIVQEEIIESVDAKINYIKTMLGVIKGSMKSHVIITNLSLPFYSPLGIRDANSDYGARRLVSDINSRISSLAKEFGNVTIFDFDNFASYHGTKKLTDGRYWYMGRIYISNDLSVEFCSDLAQTAASYYGKAKKCLVVDLDNTLWGGVIGEDFTEGIKLGEGPLGEIYSEIQRLILNLHDNGTILAINSKNNMEDVEPAFSHKGMVLKKNNFAAVKCNWDDKAANFIDISRELNIGLDSMAYLDDNPMEREAIKEKLPQIYVIDFPDDVSELPGLLKTLKIFDLLKISKEDTLRTKMYLEERQREDLKKSFSSLNDYLFDLGMELEVEKLNDGNIERIFQLINKTNQFNLRTKRYTKEEVSEFMNSDEYRAYAASLKDKFGDFGIIGTIILERKKDCWFIDTFLLSCRAMSRGVERQFLRQALLGIDGMVCGEYIKTSKNAPVESLYRELGFESDNGLWWLDLSKKQIEDVQWIKVVLNACN